MKSILGRDVSFDEHIERCCSTHGCFYGYDDECPVAKGTVGQKAGGCKKCKTTGTEDTGGRGRKFDGDKPRWCLLMWKEVEEVVKVLTLGSLKYEDHNWQRVPNAKTRYFSALHRHLSAWWDGEQLDQETGLSHLAHACCCLLFLMWFDNNKDKKDESPEV